MTFADKLAIPTTVGCLERKPHQADVYGVHVHRHFRVDHGLVGLYDALENYGLHLLRGDPSLGSQGGNAVENHHVDLQTPKKKQSEENNRGVPENEAAARPRRESAKTLQNHVHLIELCCKHFPLAIKRS